MTFLPKYRSTFVLFLFLISCLSKPLKAQSDAEVSIAQTLMFTNELANYTDDTATRKVMNVINSVYNASYDIKDVFSGKGSGAALNQSAIELTTSLAALTGNPKLQRAAKNMSEFNAGYQDIKSNFGAGMDATTSATMDYVALAVQGAILLEALLSKPDPTPGQIAAKKYIKYTNNLLVKVYGEYSQMPEQDRYDEKAWLNIEKFDNKLLVYNKATAKQRLLVLKYITSKDLPEFTTVQQWSKEIKTDCDTKGLAYIVAEVDRLTNVNTESHLKNAEQSLNGAKASVLLFKVNYCYKNGKPAEAEKWTEQLASIAPYEETKTALNGAFEEGNYILASRLSPVFFAHWIRSMNNVSALLKVAKKSQIEAITIAGKNLSADIAIVGKGIVALAKTGQYTNAQTYMEQVITKYDSFMLMGKQKYMIATEYNPDAGTEKIYFNHAKGIILQQQGKNEEALHTIDSSIFYANQNYLLSGYRFRIEETKVDMLITQKQYDKALSECAMVERDFNALNRAQNYDAVNFKLMKALIFYNMGKYQPALNTLTALKAIKPDMPKCYLLEKEIYIALNDKEAVKQAEATIFKLYNKQ